MSKITPVIILGMHRSGTSCMAGCLEEAGLYLGNVNTQAPFNKKGNRENRDFMELYDHVLKRVSASWDTPPLTPPIWQNNELENLQKLIDTFPTDRLWGTKDPRAMFMLEAWLQLTSPRFIGTFRHPEEVSASLRSRAKIWGHPMSEKHALDLWAAYNTLLIQHYNTHNFRIIRYDIPHDIYLNKLTQAGEELGLSVPQKLEFRTPELHNQHIEKPVPSHLQSIWETLNEIAL